VNASAPSSLTLVALGSGSKGNCTWIGDDQGAVLIDAGISNRQIQQRLAHLGLQDIPIQAVLLTHEHSDHIGACGVLDRAHRKKGREIPFYATAGTASGMPNKVRPTELKRVLAGMPIELDGWRFESVPVPHDTPEPVSWAVERNGVRAGVVTDLGRPTKFVERMLQSLDMAVIEFNHDLDRLMSGPYPLMLKRRIRSGHGHMSNAQAAELLASCGDRLQSVVLGHLSEENNSPALAAEAARQALEQARRTDVRVQVGHQRESKVLRSAAKAPRQGSLFG